MKGYLKIAVIITICSWLLWTLCHLFGIDYDIALIELMLIYLVIDRVKRKSETINKNNIWII